MCETIRWHMIWQFSPYSIVLAASAGVSIFVAILTLRRWAVPGSVSLALFMLAVAEGSIGYAFEYSIIGIPGKVICSKIEYIGLVTAPMFFLLFALEYTRKDKWLNTWNMFALWIIPVLTLGLAFTNELHHLIWTSFTPAPNNMLIYGHGLWFWVYGVYYYILIAIATLLLIRALARFPKYHRSRVAAVLVGVLLPWIGNAANAIGLIPIPGLDLAPVALSITGAIMAYSVYKFELLNLTPVARDALIEDMNDSVIVLDTQDRIVDINPAACRLLRVDKAPIGEFGSEFLGKWPDLVAGYEHPNEYHTEFRLDNDPPVYLDVHVSPVSDRQKNPVGKLIVLRDITNLKAIEQAERLSRQRLTEILETIPDGIVIVDRNGLISYVNPSAEKLFGLARSDLVGRSYNTPEWKITTPDGSPIRDEDLPFAQVMKTGSPIFGVELVVSHPSGERFTLSMNAAALRGVDGCIEGMVTALEDITRRHQAQQIVAQKVEELSILNRINLAITAGLDFDHVLKTLHEQCRQVVSSDIFYVALYEEQTGLVHIPLYYDVDYRPGPSLDIHSAPGLIGDIIASHQTHYLGDMLDQSSPTPVHIMRPGTPQLRSYVGIPLFLRDKVIGVMTVQSYQPYAYTEDQIRLLENIAVQAAIAIENARLYSEVQRMAIIDDLTNTYNYRGLLELGAREVERARRFSHPLTVLFFDIDGFKNYNNKYSHVIGNMVLEKVAVRCRSILRSVDIIARYGGDEFVILLPETDLPTGRKVAHRLRREIATAKVVTNYGRLDVTVSVGVADLTENTPDFTTLIDRANQAEHVAKLKGDCVSSYRENMPASQAGKSTSKKKP